MNTNTHPGHNGLQPANASPATDSRFDSTVTVTGVLSDYLSHPKSAEEMRQNVRTWFLSNIEGWEERPGTNLATQTQHFAALDEFLAGLAQAARPTV